MLLLWDQLHIWKIGDIHIKLTMKIWIDTNELKAKNHRKIIIKLIYLSAYHLLCFIVVHLENVLKYSLKAIATQNKLFQSNITVNQTQTSRTKQAKQVEIKMYLNAKNINVSKWFSMLFDFVFIDIFIDGIKISGNCFKMRLYFVIVWI